MDLDTVKKMLGNTDRIQKLLKLVEEHDAEDEQRKQARYELMVELQTLTGSFAEAKSTRAKQKCTWVDPDGKVCGSTEHNKRFHNKEQPDGPVGNQN